MLPIDEERRNIELVDRVANIILDLGLEDFAEQMFTQYGSLEVLGQTAFVSVTPMLTALYGADGFDIAKILTLSPRDGSALMMKRLKELKVERKRLKEMEPLTGEGKSFWSTINSWFSKKNIKPLHQ